jgi:hypothetical protein
LAAEPTRADAPQELRLEGFRLVASVLALGGFVLAAVIGAFLLGRWVERRADGGGDRASARGGPLEQVVAPGEPLEVERGLTRFDEVGAGGSALEPGREAARAVPRAAEPTAESRDSALAPPGPGAGAAAGPFFVQVFAGRDRDSAEQLVGRLQSSGYRVEMLSERAGRDELFKVRVGGYPSDDDARQASEALRSAGFGGAWVLRAE